jgi:hypothetical protein
VTGALHFQVHPCAAQELLAHTSEGVGDGLAWQAFEQ